MRALTTLSLPCTDCWLLNMGCTTTHCFKECVLNWELPITSENNAHGSDGTDSYVIPFVKPWLG